MPIVENFTDIHRRMEEAAKSVGRDINSITLLAVSKTHPAIEIEKALAAGQFVFGENRVQEAEKKFPRLKVKYPGLKLHMIGPLQTNKVKQAVALFDAIHSVDRPRPRRSAGQ